jgi:hypothetical protein
MAATRAEINRANSQHSTGPTSARGKARSSQNSFKHGLYSKELIIQGEDPAEFDHLRATLRDEHQPANTVEQILVDELARKRTGRKPAPSIRRGDSADLGAVCDSVVRD